ncbi:hypothetical protein DFH09DRAFT_1067810 [Mycena vulgaris]|nr:hypothetical protein DFH09DRAFT_1067810 [Mycena vulgaris]
MDWLEDEVGEVSGENRNWNPEQPRRSRGRGGIEAGLGRAKSQYLARCSMPGCGRSRERQSDANASSEATKNERKEGRKEEKEKGRDHACKWRGGTKRARQQERDDIALRIGGIVPGRGRRVPQSPAPDHGRGLRTRGAAWAPQTGEVGTKRKEGERKRTHLVAGCHADPQRMAHDARAYRNPLRREGCRHGSSHRTWRLTPETFPDWGSGLPARHPIHARRTLCVLYVRATTSGASGPPSSESASEWRSAAVAGSFDSWLGQALGIVIGGGGGEGRRVVGRHR